MERPRPGGAVEGRKGAWPDWVIKREWLRVNEVVNRWPVRAYMFTAIYRPTPGLQCARDALPTFTCLLAEYAIRTLGGVGGTPRKGRSYPVLRSYLWYA